jgi:hypothetical protein
MKAIQITCLVSSSIGGLCGFGYGIKEVSHMEIEHVPVFLMEALVIPIWTTVCGACAGLIPPYGAYIAYRVMTKDTKVRHKQ